MLKPSLADLDLFLRKHSDFRGITERGLCVLVLDPRYGTTSVTVSSLTAEQRAELSKGRCGRLTKEELADARQYGVELPRMVEKREPTMYE